MRVRRRRSVAWWRVAWRAVRSGRPSMPQIVGRPLGRPGVDGAASSSNPVVCAAIDVVVDEAVADEHVDHREDHRDVGARQRLDEDGRPRPASRVGEVRIGSTTTIRAPPARASSIVRPQVAVRELGVRTPQDDHDASVDASRSGRRGRADPLRQDRAGAGDRTAHRADRPARGAETVEEPVAGPNIDRRLWLPASE